jgi:hypothetical protein
MAIAAVTTTIVASNSNDTKSLLMRNAEVLANDEVLSGKECRFPGSSEYGDWIPCTASYPDLGKCGGRVAGYYSSDTGQCYE